VSIRNMPRRVCIGGLCHATGWSSAAHASASRRLYKGSTPYVEWMESRCMDVAAVLSRHYGRVRTTLLYPGLNARELIQSVSQNSASIDAWPLPPFVTPDDSIASPVGHVTGKAASQGCVASFADRMGGTTVAEHDIHARTLRHLANGIDRPTAERNSATTRRVHGESVLW
jgi:hypothetical protein